MNQDPDAIDIVNQVKSKRKTQPKPEPVKTEEALPPVVVHKPTADPEIEPPSETEKTPPAPQPPKKKRVMTETQKENLRKGREIRAMKQKKTEDYANQPPINRHQMEKALWEDLEALKQPPQVEPPKPPPVVPQVPVYDKEIETLKAEISTLRKTLTETTEKIPKKKDPYDNPYFKMFHGRKN